MTDQTTERERRPASGFTAKTLIPGITTVILTYNEEIHVERAIKCAQTISRDVLVVDSYSTDRTVEIARACGARVLQNPFESHARQFAWALAHGDVDSEWTLRLDADELIGSDLSCKINHELRSIPIDVVGVIFNRRHIFMGKWVRHGGRYPLLLLRLWRTGQGRVEDRWMDEHVVVDSGRTMRMDGEFADASEHDLSLFVTKHNGYAAREAIEVLNERYGLFQAINVNSGSSGGQARLKRFIKQHIYNHLPFGFGSVGYFVYRYVFQLGFLDGRTGTIYHMLQGLWYRFLVEAKILEFERAIKDCSTNAERVSVLKRVTGLKL